MSALLFCRECAEGKHRNCDGTAWDNEADATSTCTCPHPDHMSSRAAAAIADLVEEDGIIRGHGGMVARQVSRDEERFPVPTGNVSRRIHGARNALRSLAVAAGEAAQGPDVSIEAAAALRGKRQAYLEAERLVAALERGWRLPRFKWGRS